jgi:hypothetical protein
MDKKFVRVVADVDCEWEGWNPVYRVYVNDELFAERTWRWTDCYLEENLQIRSEPGCIPSALGIGSAAPGQAVSHRLARGTMVQVNIKEQKLRILDES